ncbi:protein of unknown function [Pseudodesulfovibrio profundus]|uniref:NYN domain-containing protein n=1 Tax=Pseudodesulfovibrio profundus TaxID=57320 RepID=A0A2C8F2Q3_9BACT|nr:hypothetical protein [Pseudodesulfovibrio profundus]SOB56984.1 protein of unknown function [Pseudodesulfovibrio profundus]
MQRYRLDVTMLGLQLVLVLLIDVENVSAEYIKNVMAIAKWLGVKVYAFAFWTKGKRNKALEEAAKEFNIKIVYVEVKEAGDQSVDDEIKEWINKGKVPQDANVICVVASDKGYLKLREVVRLSNRAFVIFRIGRDLCASPFRVRALRSAPNLMF